MFMPSGSYSYIHLSGKEKGVQNLFAQDDFILFEMILGT